MSSYEFLQQEIISITADTRDSWLETKSAPLVAQVHRPQSNGLVERFHRTLLEEHLRIQGRTKFYGTLEEIQKDLEDYLVRYNSQGPHQGLNMKGGTPTQAFREGLPIDSKGGTKKAA